jgi:colicin import membrane protein
MPRPLKVFRAHLGFYDTVVAVPSQKAAAQAWGAGAREFAQGFARVTDDPRAVEAALAQPGVVLRRPAGSKGAFKAEPDAPEAARPTPTQTRRAAEARRKTAQDARREAARQKREQARQAAADAELAEIEAEEAKLRARRRKLQKNSGAARRSAR